MKHFLLFVFVLLTLTFTACNQEDSDIPPSYEWKAADVSWALVWLDSIETPPDCFVDYIFGRDFERCGMHAPKPYEGHWNCTQQHMERRGDTVFLKAFNATGPDENWHTSFSCLDQYEPFVLDAKGNGIHVGKTPLTYDPEVRLNGDTLSFKMTFMVFDRGITQNSEAGATQGWIRHHQYGFQYKNLDSLQKALQKYCEPMMRYFPLSGKYLNNCSYPGEEAHYMVGWRRFLYVASDSVIVHNE